jgi:hypothetical protein
MKIFIKFDFNAVCRRRETSQTRYKTPDTWLVKWNFIKQHPISEFTDELKEYGIDIIENRTFWFRK